MTYEPNLFPYTKNFKTNKIKIVLVLIVLFVFAFSLTQDAFIVEEIKGNVTFPSLNLLLGGALAILCGATFEWMIWWANPICLFAIILFLYNDNNLRLALLLNLTALFLSGLFYTWREIMISESGSMAKIISFEIGYFIWVASIFLLLVFQLIYYYFSKLKTK